MVWSAYWPDMVAGFMFFAGLMMLASDDWRWLLFYLAVVYAGATALMTLVWPWTLAVTVLVGGWMAAAVLGLSQQTVIATNPRRRLGVKVLRLSAGLLIALAAVAVLPSFASWLPSMGASYLWSSLVLMLLGVWQAGLHSSNALWVVAGLLTTFAGFAVLYAALEQSLLLAGLIALVVVALALAGGYLVVQQESVAEEPEARL